MRSCYYDHKSNVVFFDHYVIIVKTYHHYFISYFLFKFQIEGEKKNSDI